MKHLKINRKSRVEFPVKKSFRQELREDRFDVGGVAKRRISSAIVQTDQRIINRQDDPLKMSHSLRHHLCSLQHQRVHFVLSPNLVLLPSPLLLCT